MRRQGFRGRTRLRPGAKPALYVFVAGLAACLLGLLAGLGGGVAPAAAEAGPAPVSEQESQTELEAGAAQVLDVDVLVFSTQTSGLAAVRELAVGAPHLRVALISAGNLLETPLAQGLGVEDARDIGRVKGGFYDEWRRAVIRSYSLRGLRPYNAGGRFVYEPDVSAQALWSFVRGANAPNVLFYSGRLVAASDQEGGRYADVQVENGGVVRFNTRYFIDASVEGDLARMLGASYRIGRHEAVYNDVAGVKPEYPTAANGYETAPQWFSPLLTLKVYATGYAPRIATLVHPNYNPATYALLAPMNQKNVTAFKNSWTMNYRGASQRQARVERDLERLARCRFGLPVDILPGEKGGDTPPGAGVVHQSRALSPGARVSSRGDRRHTAEVVRPGGAAHRGPRYLHGRRSSERVSAPSGSGRLLHRI